MKKILFAALLFAGATLGFAKDNVQNQKSTNIESSKVESNVEKSQTTYQFDSIEEVQKSFAECTDVTIATQMIAQADGSFEEEVVSMCESTYPCVSGGTRTYLIRL